jgi:hypothetical protein
MRFCTLHRETSSIFESSQAERKLDSTRSEPSRASKTGLETRKIRVELTLRLDSISKLGSKLDSTRLGAMSVSDDRIQQHLNTTSLRSQHISRRVVVRNFSRQILSLIRIGIQGQMTQRQVKGSMDLFRSKGACPALIKIAHKKGTNFFRTP